MVGGCAIVGWDGGGTGFLSVVLVIVVVAGMRWADVVVVLPDGVVVLALVDVVVLPIAVVVVGRTDVAVVPVDVVVPVGGRWSKIERYSGSDG
ncbi:hypothetical protein ACIHDR_13540 [Nocardia sp. NPDC052278]|uniref:hypothetical protein n=1 Tax=unclassified Nocardia TaxID=2637762 RepID=UPI00368970D3